MPATPTLTIADNADGTGAMATVSGSDTGSTNDIYVANWSGTLVASAFSVAGSRVGDGNIAIAGLGYKWAYVLSSLSGVAVSSVVGFRATEGDESKFEIVANAVVAKLQSLTFDGIGASNIILQKLPFNLGQISAAGIFVSPVVERFGTEFNNAYDVLYGIQVAAFAPSNRNLTSNLGRSLMWRQQIRNAFHLKPLPNIGENGFHCRVEAGPVFDVSAFKDQYDAGSWIIRPYSRESI